MFSAVILGSTNFNKIDLNTKLKIIDPNAEVYIEEELSKGLFVLSNEILNNSNVFCILEVKSIHELNFVTESLLPFKNKIFNGQTKLFLVDHGLLSGKEKETLFHKFGIREVMTEMLTDRQILFKIRMIYKHLLKDYSVTFSSLFSELHHSGEFFVITADCDIQDGFWKLIEGTTEQWEFFDDQKITTKYIFKGEKPKLVNGRWTFKTKNPNLFKKVSQVDQVASLLKSGDSSNEDSHGSVTVLDPLNDANSFGSIIDLTKDDNSLLKKKSVVKNDDLNFSQDFELIKDEAVIESLCRESGLKRPKITIWSKNQEDIMLLRIQNYKDFEKSFFVNLTANLLRRPSKELNKEKDYFVSFESSRGKIFYRLLNFTLRSIAATLKVPVAQKIYNLQRRIDPRLNIEHLNLEASIHEGTLKVFIKNISVSGLMIVIQSNQALDEKETFEIKVNSELLKFTAKGQVVWSKDGSFNEKPCKFFGVKFKEIDKISKVNIECFIYENIYYKEVV